MARQRFTLSRGGQASSEATNSKSAEARARGSNQWIMCPTSGISTKRWFGILSIRLFSSARRNPRSPATTSVGVSIDASSAPS